MLGDNQFYEESFQPRIVFGRYEDGMGEYIVRFGPETTFGMLPSLAEKVDVWIHEFVEFSVYMLLISVSKLEWITLIYKRDGLYTKWTQHVSHIITSSICKSWLDGSLVDADVYWDDIMNIYSKRLQTVFTKKPRYNYRDGFTELVDGLL
jgi:hypothetical protein